MTLKYVRSWRKNFRSNLKQKYASISRALAKGLSNPCHDVTRNTHWSSGRCDAVRQFGRSIKYLRCLLKLAITGCDVLYQILSPLHFNIFHHTVHHHWHEFLWKLSTQHVFNVFPFPPLADQCSSCLHNAGLLVRSILAAGWAPLFQNMLVRDQHPYGWLESLKRYLKPPTTNKPIRSEQHVIIQAMEE